MARYLVVDDSPTVRLRLAGALRQLSASAPDILEASDGPQALEAFRTGPGPVDMVFLDMMLGDNEGGLDILRSMLRERPEANIVLVTALPGDHPDVTAAVSLGASGRLGKPVQTDELRRVLSALEVGANQWGRIGRAPRWK